VDLNLFPYEQRGQLFLSLNDLRSWAGVGELRNSQFLYHRRQEGIGLHCKLHALTWLPCPSQRSH
jgi:hypothetical protein